MQGGWQTGRGNAVCCQDHAHFNCKVARVMVMVMLMVGGGGGGDDDKGGDGGGGGGDGGDDDEGGDGGWWWWCCCKNRVHSDRGAGVGVSLVR